VLLESGLRNRGDIWSERDDPRRVERRTTPKTVGLPEACAP